MLNVRQLESALILAPHPDDEVLGAGGLISRLSSHGCRVEVIFASVDGMQHWGTEHQTTVEEREAEIRAAEGVLSFISQVLYRGRGLMERLDTVPQRELVDAFEAALNRVKPDILLLPHGVDFDQDHVACFRAGFAAARPIPPHSGKFLVRRVVSYESPKLAWSESPFHPNLHVDIGEHLARKLDAIRCYKSQFRLPPHVRSLENISALARIRGSEAGVDFAEGFLIHRWVI